jgi:exocyst complex component 1
VSTRANHSTTSVLETYITHIRITEFSNSPTSPPPPQAKTGDSEKPRVIIIAVRKSGRVRMHKSKENANGTFSIGKTWNLDDLTHVESFTGPNASPNSKEQAGDTGFVVTIGKPYFWQAQTEKEKKFFIASLIKIYGKYTGGRAPELVGFDQREMDQILGSGKRQLSGGAGRPPLLEPTASQGNLSVSSTQGIAGAPPSSYSQGAPSRIGGPLNGTASPAGSIDSTRSQNQQALRRLAGSNKSQDSVANSIVTARSDDGTSLPPRSRNGMAGPGALGRFADPNEPLPQDEKNPPERKRPPMDPARPGIADRDLVPPPLMSPGMRRDPVAPPPRSMDRVSPRKNSLDQRSETNSLKGSFRERAERAERSMTPSDLTKDEVSATVKSPLNGTFPNTATSPLPTEALPAQPVPPAPPAEPDESRPGLGPMIKSKKSKGDIAGAFWKAATAASVFKPRPGGAGDRLRQAQNKSTDGPDGITSVVPAPPRPASITSEATKSQTPEPQKAPDRISGLPEVKVTVPNSSRPNSLQSSVKDARKSEDASVVEEKRRSIVVGNDSKYLATLGVDPSILDTRSAEFTKWLDYFGWVPGDQMRSRNFDEMKADIDRELNKAQAGGWLARFREEDERVGAIKKGLDLAMTECEELDNLLTLYSVELSVGSPAVVSDCQSLTKVDII